MKVLFVTHTTGYGGAAISLTTNLEYLLESGKLKAKECLLAVPPNKDNILTDAYHKFNGKVPFLFWHMPFSTAYKGGSTKPHVKVYSIVKELISILSFITVYNRRIKQEGITHIHLNSMVFWSLLPFLPKDIKKVIHVREMITDDYSGKIARRIINRYADTIIAISNQTAKGLPKSEIVENPYDMYRARQFRNIRQELKLKFGIPLDSFVVSVFSPIGKQKGSEFLLEVVRNMPSELPIHFVVVGDPFRGEQKLYRDLLNEPNVHIYETSSDMNRFYAMTDTVLRCEKYLPLGRTVYEGIYAGCMAVLPIAKTDSFKESPKYLTQVYTYRAEDTESCIHVIRGIYRNYPTGIYDNRFAPTTNVPESAENLLTVLT